MAGYLKLAAELWKKAVSSWISCCLSLLQVAAAGRRKKEKELILFKDEAAALGSISLSLSLSLSCGWNRRKARAGWNMQEAAELMLEEATTPCFSKP